MGLLGECTAATTMNPTESNMVNLRNPDAGPRRLLSTLVAATLLGGYAVPAVAADYFFVTFSRQKISINSKECPQFQLQTREVETEQEANALRKEALGQKDREDIRAEMFQRKHGTVIVYTYTGTSDRFKHCRYTRYSYATGKTLEAAEKKMMGNAKTYKAEYLTAPQPTKIWPR